MKIFLDENTRINLSAFRTEESCWAGNILDSLSALGIFPQPATSNSKLSLLDLGTGGGFPLLPLAISLPNIRFTGLDSTQKKMDAVRRIAKQMDLTNVELIAGRAEVLGHEKKFREQFNVVTARAVAEINVLLEYCSPLVKPGGKIVLWKSLNAGEELKASEKAQREFRCPFKESVVYELPGDFGKRQLLIFEKIGKLSEEYPRSVGTPKKNPV